MGFCGHSWHVIVPKFFPSDPIKSHHQSHQSPGNQIRWGTFHSNTYIYILLYICTLLWLFNIAMDNGPFMDDSSWFTYQEWWFSMATLNNQRVYFFKIFFDNICKTRRFSELVFEVFFLFHLVWKCYLASTCRASFCNFESSKLWMLHLGGVFFTFWIG